MHVVWRLAWEGTEGEGIGKLAGLGICPEKEMCVSCSTSAACSKFESYLEK